MRRRWMLVGLMVAAMASAAMADGSQHLWARARKAAPAATVRPSAVRPQAAIGLGSPGIFCPDMADSAVGVHDLGWIPVGMTVIVTVESYSDAPFDPVAAVAVVNLGLGFGNTAKVQTFYDNDSGGDGDAQITFVTTQAGTYLLFVTDNAGKTQGCYRYRVDIG